MSTDIEYELIPHRRRSRIALYIVLILMTLPVAIPYAWLIIGSFATDLRGVIPTGFTLENWKFLVEPIKVPAAGVYFPDVWTCTLNTLIIAIGTTALTVILSLLGGYALSRIKFFGRGALLSLVMIVRAFPGITLIVALFYIVNYLKLYGSVTSVILTKTAMMLPLGLWVMKGFFDAIPWDIEMAALVDGLSRLKTFFKILVPQVKPGIAALGILTFISAWSEFILVLIFTDPIKAPTLTMLVKSLAQQAFTGEVAVAGITRPMIIAVGLWYMLPVIIFVILTQKYLLRVAAGGVKGA